LVFLRLRKPVCANLKIFHSLSHFARLAGSDPVAFPKLLLKKFLPYGAPELHQNPVSGG
jgi:hypothetical protein